MEAIGVVPSSIQCHACGGVIDLTGHQAFAHVDCSQCGAISVVPVKFGDFLLLHAMGEGGVGAVYKAMDLSLNRFVALKILRKKLASNPDFIENFSREAHAAARVNHPNVAQIYSFGAHEGQYYLSMEILEGGSLDDRMMHTGQIAESDTLAVAIAAAKGLRAAHERGMLHRDVKPGNILFNSEGVPKIVDFGLARPPSLGSEKGKAEPIWGTPYYIAPEKLRGQPEDLQSDIYSLGATLFHAMAGRPPYEGESAWQVASKHATLPSVSLKSFVPQIHDRTVQVIGRMLAKNPVERYANYDGLIHDLEAALEETCRVDTERVIVTDQGERFSVRSAVITVGAFFGCVLAGLLIWHYALRSEPTTNGSIEPPPPNDTNITAIAVNTAEVDFNRRTSTGARPDWLVLWDASCLALDFTDFEAAIEKLDRARRTTVDQPLWNRWMQFYLGLTQSMDLRAYGSDAARDSFLAALDPSTPFQVPENVTTDNFVNTLAAVMLGKVPLADVQAASGRLPPWARALVTICQAIQQQHALDFEGAATTYAAYAGTELQDADRWATRLQGIAVHMATRNRQAHEAMQQLDALIKKGDQSKIDAWITKTLANPPVPDLKQAIEKRRPPS